MSSTPEPTATDISKPVTKGFTKIYHNKPYDAISPLRPELSMAGKNVVVTGGGTGIGKAIAQAFAQANAASVSILGRREERLISASKEISESATGATKVLYRVTDLTDSTSTQASFKSIGEEVGTIDMLVSNAGAIGGGGHVAKIEITGLMKSFDLNVRTAFNAIQAFLPLAGANPTFINISSAAIHIPPIPGAVAYTASKMAALKAVEYLAGENPGLSVFQVQPGIVATEINEGIPGVDQDRPELPGCFCVWLASPEAQFLRNKFIWSNWDVTELKERADEIKTSKLLTFQLNGFPE